MNKKLYVDKNMTIFTGEQAEHLLHENNDLKFLSESSGIVKVTQDRWMEAQSGEYTAWMEQGRGSSSDRNEDHFKGFDDYSALKSLRFVNAIELGCGPFTNLRIIGKICDIDCCTLLDPLVNHYLSHPHCSYSKDFLYLETKNPILRNIDRFHPKYFRKLQDLLNMRIPVKEIISSSIELMPEGRHYDLVVLINVLEHCYDAEAIFKKILEITSVGAILVFHEKMYRHEDVISDSARFFGAIHPLKVDRSVITAFLENNFTGIYRVENNVSDRFCDLLLKWKNIYFIGRRK
jgi:hypothetical protein